MSVTQYIDVCCEMSAFFFLMFSLIFSCKNQKRMLYKNAEGWFQCSRACQADKV